MFSLQPNNNHLGRFLWGRKRSLKEPKCRGKSDGFSNLDALFTLIFEVRKMLLVKPSRSA